MINLKKYSITGFLISLLFFGWGCSTTRVLQEDEQLYKGAEVDVNNKGFFAERSLERDLENYLEPGPNSRMLGLIPLKLWLYNLAGTEVPEKGFRNWLQEKAGEEPVVFEERFISSTKRNLSNRLFNTGYFDFQIQTEKESKNQKIKINYKIEVSEPYELADIHYPEPMDTLNDSLGYFIQKATANKLIKKGDRFEIEKLEKERTRISNYLHNEGFYDFSPDYIIFKIDSNKTHHTLDVYAEFKENIPAGELKRFTINDIYVYTDYSLNVRRSNFDTTIIENIHFLRNRKNFKHQIILQSLLFEKGQHYRREAHRATINKLMGLGIFKFVNIEYNEKSDSLENLLDAHVYCTRAVPRSFSAKIQAITKSNNFSGPRGDISYQDRNFFNGAESFNLSLNGGFESQFSGSDGLDSWDIALEAGIAVPRFIFPFFDPNKYLSRSYTPKTIFRAGYNYLDRVNYFNMHSVNLNYAYNWRESPSRSHELQILSINYSNLLDTSPEFDSLLQEDFLVRQSFNEQFNLSFIYDYVYNNQVYEEKQIHTYLQTNIEFSGNTLNLFNRLISGRKPTPENPLEFLGIEYSQFIRTFGDLRLYFELPRKSKLVNRWFAGLGYAYGNSDVLPYRKQFYSGGSGSLRGFRYRSIGPGSFNPLAEDRSFFDQTGDIKLESNLEYRFRITQLFRAALFIDAGNIWLMDSNPEKPGGTFEWGNFLSEVAVNGGFGLRLDASFVVLRLDLGVPFRKPYRTEEERWVFDEFNLSDPEWRRNNLVLNLAIGYPF